MKHDSMIEALKRGRANGFDITISVNPVEDEVGPGEGLMGVEEGEESPVEDAEAERQELDLAPIAEEMDGEVLPEQKAEADVERNVIQDELEKANFGKSSLMARKKNELSKNKV